MENIRFFNIKGQRINADFVFALTVPELNKTFVALNNSDLVFSDDSSYNNIDILELVKEDGNNFYITDIKDEDWDLVKQTVIDELLSKIK